MVNEQLSDKDAKDLLKKARLSLYPVFIKKHKEAAAYAERRTETASNSKQVAEGHVVIEAHNIIVSSLEKALEMARNG